MADNETLTLHLQDASGQREFVARDVPKEASWGEILKGMVANMSLPKNPDGGNLWTGRLEREGRHLHTSEIVGEALEDGDKIVLAPEVDAGSQPRVS